MNKNFCVPAVSAAIGAIVLVGTSGCGTNYGQDAAAAISSGIQSGMTGLGDKPAAIFLNSQDTNRFEDTKQAADLLAQQALQRFQDRLSVASMVDGPRTTPSTWCGAVTSYTSWASYSSPDGKLSCSIACTGGNLTITVKFAKTVKASACGNTYTFSDGSVSLAWADGPLATTPSTYTLGISATVSGGKLKSSGSAVACAFGFNLSTFSSNPTCSGLSSYSCTVDGSSVGCSDWEKNANSCSATNS